MEECKKQFELAKIEVDKYNQRYSQFEKDLASYNDYKRVEYELENCTAGYQELCKKHTDELKKHVIAWENCVFPHDINNVTHNDWCENDRGPDYRHKLGSFDWNSDQPESVKDQFKNCPFGQGRGQCVLKDSAIPKRVQQILRETEPPYKHTFDKKDWSGKAVPVAPVPGDINLSCCAQDFGDMKAEGNAKIDFGDITQDCKQIIDSGNIKNETSTENTTPTTTAANTKTTKTTNYFIAGGLLSLSSIFVFILFIIILNGMK